MKIINNKVNYIWVGDNEIPTDFLDNYKKTKKLNPTYEFKIWKEIDIIDILDNSFKELFKKSSLFHKLQIGRYSVANLVGGIVCDFDIEWKVDFDTVYNIKDDFDVMFTKRKSLYFFNRGQKTTLLDDYVMITKPNITCEFLQFCLDRTERKDDITEPFSVYALTEWCLTKDNVGLFEPSEIYDTDDTTIAYHYNNGFYLILNCFNFSSISSLQSVRSALVISIASNKFRFGNLLENTFLISFSSLASNIISFRICPLKNLHLK